MIEIGHHPNANGAMLLHSTYSGRFLPAGRAEVKEFIDAAKAGAFDGLFQEPPTHPSASAAAPAPAVDRDHP